MLNRAFSTSSILNLSGLSKKDILHTWIVLSLILCDEISQNGRLIVIVPFAGIQQDFFKFLTIQETKRQMNAANAYVVRFWES